MQFRTYRMKKKKESYAILVGGLVNGEESSR